MKDIIIPDWLMQAIEQKDFYELSDAEKSGVHESFSETEYREIRATVLAIRESQDQEQTRGKERIKRELLAEFDKKHRSKKPSIAWSTKWLAAASLFFFLASAGLVFWNQDQAKSIPQVVEKVIRDTVYQERLVEVIHTDTVLQKETVFIHTESRKPQMPAQTKTPMETPTELGVGIPNPKNLEAEIRPSKSPRLDQDTLVKEFGFVSL